MIHYRRFVILIVFVLTFSGFCSIASASNPIPPGSQAIESGSVTDFTSIIIYGKKWEEVNSGDLLRLYYMKLGQEQLQGNTVTTPVTTTTTPVTTTTTPVTTSGTEPSPIKSIFLKSTVTNVR